MWSAYVILELLCMIVHVLRLIQIVTSDVYVCDGDDDTDAEGDT